MLAPGNQHNICLRVYWWFYQINLLHSKLSIQLASWDKERWQIDELSPKNPGWEKVVNTAYQSEWEWFQMSRVVWSGHNVKLPVRSPKPCKKTIMRDTGVAQGWIIGQLSMRNVLTCSIQWHKGPLLCHCSTIISQSRSWWKINRGG